MRMAGTVIDPAIVVALAESATGDEKLAAAEIANAALEDGDTASNYLDLDKGTVTYRDDGDPYRYIGRGGQTVRQYDSGAAYPGLGNRTVNAPGNRMYSGGRVFDAMQMGGAVEVNSAGQALDKFGNVL